MEKRGRKRKALLVSLTFFVTSFYVTSKLDFDFKVRLLKDSIKGDTVSSSLVNVKYCKVTPFEFSKLRGVPNVQKSISKWRQKRIFSGKESSVPLYERKSILMCGHGKNPEEYTKSLYTDSSNLNVNYLLEKFGKCSSKCSKPSEMTFTSGKTCEDKLSFAFVLSSQEGSGKLRGFMIADELNKRGHTAITVFGKEGPLWPDPLGEIKSCKKLHFCIFVKWDSRSFPRILNECVQRGAKVFIDLLDYCDSNRKNIVDMWPKNIDGFILQNEFQRELFTKAGYSLSFVLEHQHTNLEARVNKIRDTARTIGFTGSRKNSEKGVTKLLAAVETWGKKNGMKVIRTISNRMEDSKKQNDVYDQKKYHTGLINEVDIALVWPKIVSSSEVFFKPITRFVYWLSHGIPTIVFPTESYLEVGSRYNYPLFANNTDTVLEWLEILTLNSELRKNISSSGLEIAREFSLPRVVQKYENIFCELQFYLSQLDRGKKTLM
mmetsp:Transcript_5378/g.17017  ORF Transcript_5378/g.17017 Transcript_5378/m.17017 type:complete len:490 (+) Transcript_5378:352-1821(+)